MDAKTWADIAVAIWTVFGGVITYGLHKLFTAKTKNANLESFNKWADQAVTWAETNGSTTSEGKKKDAVGYLTKTLRDNNLLGKFTDSEVSAAIEFALVLFKQKTSDDTTTATLDASSITPVSSPLIYTKENDVSQLKNSDYPSSDYPKVSYDNQESQVDSNSVDVTVSNGSSSVTTSESGMDLKSDNITLNGPTTVTDSQSEATYIAK